ncbi:MAG: cell division protein FtsA [Firmicutes bacterium]|nr:cell division protein FtsA [Bacillota bacterium]
MAGLDVGTSKVAVMIAEMDPMGVRRTIGVGTGFHNGLHRGMVSDADTFVQAVMESVIKAERMAQVPMPPAVIGIPGILCSSFSARGTVVISRSNHRVQAEDVERALDAAEAVAIPPGRRVIHRLVHAFWLDGRHLDGEPLGLVGRCLEVDVQFITASLPGLEELLQCLEQAGVEIQEVIVQCLATLDMALAPSHKKLGVVLVDLGAGLTDVVVFRNSRLQHMACLPIGTENLTRDLMVGMDISFAKAERLVRQLGCNPSPENLPAQWEECEDEDFLAHCLDQYNQIFMARAEEIWQLVRNEVAKVGGGANLQAGVRMVGGGVMTPGLVDLGSSILDLSVDAALPVEMDGLPEACQNPAYAAVTGLTRHRTKQLIALSEAQASKPASWTVLWQKVRDWLEF